MKYLKQIAIILGISFVGEILHWMIPISIPASIYGIIILFMLLKCKMIKEEDIKEISGFLIEIMPVLFIPAGVGVITSWELIKSSWLTYTLILIISTVLVMGISGKVTDVIMKNKVKKN